jgi:hypothetical protein
MTAWIDAAWWEWEMEVYRELILLFVELWHRGPKDVAWRA